MFCAWEEVVFIPKIPIIPSAVIRKYTGLRFTIRTVSYGRQQSTRAGVDLETDWITRE